MSDFSHARLVSLFDLSKPDTFWRHDVDASLEAAVAMAKLEQQSRIHATYYLRFRGPNYNMLSPEGTEALVALCSFGHRVGLHVDLRVDRDWNFAENMGHLYASVLQECFAANLCDAHVVEKRLVSFHCPPYSVLWRDLPGIEYAYAAKWEGLYVSDSGGSFDYDVPEEMLARPDAVQINLHPEHWFGLREARFDPRMAGALT